MICPICKQEVTSLEPFCGSDCMHANLLEKLEILFNWCASLGYEIESDVPGEWCKTVSMFFDSHQNLERYDVLNLVNMYSFGGWLDPEHVRVLLERHYYSKAEPESSPIVTEKKKLKVEIRDRELSVKIFDLLCDLKERYDELWESVDRESMDYDSFCFLWKYADLIENMDHFVTCIDNPENV